MRKDRGMVLLLILTLVGALIGSVVGEALATTLPILSRGVSVGIDPPTTLDLFVLRLTFGLKAKLNIASAIGILLALLLFRRT